MEFPSHDPDSHVDLSMLPKIVMTTQDSCSDDTPASTASPLHPYPNLSAFLLGEWYWAQATQKSQQSFRTLLDIICNPNLFPTNVESTNWALVNHELSVNDWDKGEWIDEDAKWHCSTVKIQIPFHHYLSQSGPQEYLVRNFYHRLLTSII